jgi:catechol 2,3-dioxygenase-like lactoylglutathione lyase family enzyme
VSIVELNQVTLPVTDIPRAVAFYVRLGFRQIVDDAEYARFECRPYGPTFSVHLAPAVQAGHAAVVYFECEDLDATCAALRADGIQFESDPTDQPWLWREARLRDPAGNPICLYHAGSNRLNPPWRLESPSGRLFELDGIDHVALAVRDVPRSVDWYQRVLGLRRMYEDAWGDYPAVVGVGGTALALFPVDGDAAKERPGRDVLTMRHLAFRVDAANFAKARKGLEEQGIATTFEDHGIAHSIYFNDPDGHEIEITTYDDRQTREH